MASEVGISVSLRLWRGHSVGSERIQDPAKFPLAPIVVGVFICKSWGQLAFGRFMGWFVSAEMIKYFFPCSFSWKKFRNTTTRTTDIYPDFAKIWRITAGFFYLWTLKVSIKSWLVVWLPWILFSQSYWVYVKPSQLTKIFDGFPKTTIFQLTNVIIPMGFWSEGWLPQPPESRSVQAGVNIVSSNMAGANSGVNAMVEGRGRIGEEAKALRRTKTHRPNLRINDIKLGDMMIWWEYHMK